MRRAKLPHVLTALTAATVGAGAVMVPNVAAAAATYLTVKAADDTYTSSGRTTVTFGTDGKLAVGKLGADAKTGVP